MSWVIIRVVIWSWATTLRVTSITFSAAPGSRAAVCSSSSSSLGWATVAMSREAA